MPYRPKDGIERICRDFRGSARVPHVCMYSGSCSNLENQGMYVDNFYSGKACLGINDERRLNEIEKVCVGKPEIPSSKKVEEPPKKKFTNPFEVDYKEE